MPAGSLASASLAVLLETMRSGDPALLEAAWGECYRRFHDRVWTRVFYVVRSIPWLKEPGEVAKDVTSQVFLGLPDAVHGYRELGKAEAWLMRIALRTALRHKEALTGNWSPKGGSRSAVAVAVSRPAGRVSVDLDDVAAEIVGVMDEVENDERFDLRRRLDVWRRDPGKQRWLELIDLFLQGYAHEEIAARLGITPATSRNWLWKIRQQLAEPFDAEHDA